MPWWGWIVVGAVLLGAEIVVSADFYLVFFALGAFAVGLLGLVGVEAPIWSQWMVFAVVSITGLVAVRQRTRRYFQSHAGHVPDAVLGEVAVPTATIEPGAVGRAELRGAVWTARNAGDVPLAAGERARVEQIDGLTIHLRREG